jgi:ketosteroid isomerase-like protein
MSEENVEIVRKSVDAVNRGDIEEVLAFIDADAEYHSAIIGGAEGNLYRGHDGFRKWFAESTASFEQLDTELTEFRAVDDRVIAFGRIYARGRESGVELDSETGWVFTVRGGKIVKAEGFLSRAEALEAAGMSE